jgi:hypothetical protein
VIPTGTGKTVSGETEMKKRILSFILLLLFPAFSLAASDLDQAFLDVDWGSAPVAGEMEKITSQASIAYYTAPGKVYKVGEHLVAGAVYAFYMDRLFAVHLKIDSLETFERVKAYMRDRYGFPKTTFTMNNEQTIYRWKHKRVKMKLKRYELADAMKLSFYFAPLAEQVNRELGPKAEPPVRFLPIERDKKPEALPLLHF